LKTKETIYVNRRVYYSNRSTSLMSYVSFNYNQNKGTVLLVNTHENYKINNILMGLMHIW